MTLDYYIYEIRALLPKDWINVDNRHIIRWIDLQRALWLKNEFNNNRFIYDKVTQKIHLKMKLVNSSEISGVSSNNVILKSTVKVPTTINQYYKDSIVSIHNADILGENYNYVEKSDAIYSGNGKLNHKDVYSFIYNNYLYIKTQKGNPSIKLINKVVVEGVFENPIDVERDYIYTGDNFDFLNLEYPLPEALWTYMKEKIVNQGLITSQNEQIEERSI